MTDTSRYQIIESSLGPLISESRVTVYDVLEAHDSGLDEYQIATCYNLTPLQVQTALDYIAEHRVRLEPELRDFALTAGWGDAGRGGITMPGRGRVEERGGALDICLNETTCWATVPAEVWGYTLGGYPVLKNWLS